MRERLQGLCVMCPGMSILNYFKQKPPQERGIFWPKPASTLGISEDEVAACNNAVEAIVKKQEGEKQRKQYHSCTSQQRASIGRYATQHGPTAASRHFAKLLGH